MKKNCLVLEMCQNGEVICESTVQCDSFKDEIKQKIEAVAKECPETNFISLMRQGGDTYAAMSVLELKESYPLITLTCLIPYEEQAAEWSECERDRYFKIIESCDTEEMFSTRYTDTVIADCIEYAEKKADTVLKFDRPAI